MTDSVQLYVPLFKHSLALCLGLLLANEVVAIQMLFKLL